MHATDLQYAESQSTLRPDAIVQYQEITPESRPAGRPQASYGPRRVLLTALPLVLADLLAVLVSLAIAWDLASLLVPTASMDWTALTLGFTIGILVANVAVGMYPGVGLSPVAELRQAALAAVFIGPIFLVVTVIQSRIALPMQLVIVFTCCLLLVMLPLARAMARAFFSRFSWWGQPALVVGGNASAKLTYSYLRRNPHLGLRPVGIVADWKITDPRDAPSYLLGSLSQTHSLTDELGSPWLVVAMPKRSRGDVQRELRRLNRQTNCPTLVSHVMGSPSWWHRAGGCLGWPGQRKRTLPTPFVKWVKRCMDVTLTVVGGLLLMPLLLVIAALIKLGSPGPVMFLQQRVGRNGERFMCWKFRTMVCNGDRVLEEYLAECPLRREAWDRDHKLETDPRVTGIGRWLRKTSMDELPQLWNVLWGQMSLVGPRPILDSEIADFGADFEHFCSVTPGITGLWQVSGRNRTTYAEHIELDSYYARNWSLWLDLCILALTVRVVLFRSGAY